MKNTMELPKLIKNISIKKKRREKNTNIIFNGERIEMQMKTMRQYFIPSDINNMTLKKSNNKYWHW